MVSWHVSCHCKHLSEDGYAIVPECIPGRSAQTDWDVPRESVSVSEADSQGFEVIRIRVCQCMTNMYVYTSYNIYLYIEYDCVLFRRIRYLYYVLCNVCMYTCIFVCTDVFVYVLVHLSRYMYTYIHISECIFVCINYLIFVPRAYINPQSAVPYRFLGIMSLSSLEFQTPEIPVDFGHKIPCFQKNSVFSWEIMMVILEIQADYCSWVVVFLVVFEWQWRFRFSLFTPCWNWQRPPVSSPSLSNQISRPVRLTVLNLKPSPVWAAIIWTACLFIMILFAELEMFFFTKHPKMGLSLSSNIYTNTLIIQGFSQNVRNLLNTTLSKVKPYHLGLSSTLTTWLSVVVLWRLGAGRKHITSVAVGKKDDNTLCWKRWTW